jgi:hypothetical protein
LCACARNERGAASVAAAWPVIVVENLWTERIIALHCHCHSNSRHESSVCQCANDECTLFFRELSSNRLGVQAGRCRKPAWPHNASRLCLPSCAHRLRKPAPPFIAIAYQAATSTMPQPHTASIRLIKNQILAMFPHFNRRLVTYYTPHIRDLHNVFPDAECAACPGL